MEEREWLERSVVVGQNVGTHLRVVKRIVERVGPLDVELQIASAAHVASAKSMLDLLQLEARTGESVRLRARGPDARVAVEFVDGLLRAPTPDAEVPHG